MESGTISKINVVSDSPASQYRNKSIFWLMNQLTEENVYG